MRFRGLLPLFRSTLVLALVATGCVGLIATSAGCGDSSDEKASTQTSRQPVPSSLDETESSAEDIVDFARAGERAKVVAKAHELRRSAEGRARTALRQARVPEDRIALLSSRARLVESIAPRAGLVRVSLAANQVSALMPEFYARYATSVPPDVLKLDFLDREAQLRSQAGDTKTARAAVKELSSTWAKLRARVISADGGKVAARFTRHVAAMLRLARRSDAVALQKEAAVGLELVDRIEHVFLTDRQGREK
jgi:hypothetical protein